MSHSKKHFDPSVVDHPRLQPVRLGDDTPLRMTAKTFLTIIGFVVSITAAAILWAAHVDTRMGKIEDRVSAIDSKVDTLVRRTGGALVVGPVAP